MGITTEKYKDSFDALERFQAHCETLGDAELLAQKLATMGAAHALENMLNTSLDRDDVIFILSSLQAQVAIIEKQEIISDNLSGDEPPVPDGHDSWLDYANNPKGDSRPTCEPTCISYSEFEEIKNPNVIIPRAEYERLLQRTKSQPIETAPKRFYLDENGDEIPEPLLIYSKTMGCWAEAAWYEGNNQWKTLDGTIIYDAIEWAYLPE